MKSGFAAIIGRANVGKSSILNKILGQKVAIVSPKAQTTRDRIVGILTESDSQIVFVDTPGFHAPTNKLGDYMMRSLTEAVRGVDVVVIVLDAERGITARDNELISKYIGGKTPVIIAVNKTDLTTYEALYPALTPLNALPAEDVIPLSARTGFNLDKLTATIRKLLPEGDMLYPADEVTDKSLRYLAAETIREKILLFVQDEIPHGVQVVLEEFDETDRITNISALIICEKNSHKSIIIGKGGDMLKKIGVSARKELETLLGKQVMLRTFVKVIEDWRNKPARLSELGFTPEKHE
ncbi:MAG: GTPase Era [Clostridiales bacterium]|nr:GTPase Era [Clostridiales bacterium]